MAGLLLAGGRDGVDLNKLGVTDPPWPGGFVEAGVPAMGPKIDPAPEAVLRVTWATPQPRASESPSSQHTIPSGSGHQPATHA